MCETSTRDESDPVVQELTSERDELGRSLVWFMLCSFHVNGRKTHNRDISRRPMRADPSDCQP